MKPISLQGKITDGSALPIIIRLFQYSINRDRNNPGDIGNEYFAYSVDCRHKKLIPNGDADSSKYSDEEPGFKHFNTIFTEKADPMINRDYITKNFFVVTIPDYSFQAMTQKYTDFVVQVYTSDGRKIPQRYIGLLKSYTRRECYILISQTINNVWLNDNIALENTMNIRVIFKENIEKDAAYESGDEDDHIYTDKYDYNILKEDKNYTADNYLYSDTITLSDNLNINTSNGSFVNRQTGETIVNDEKISYDYFKQVFQIDYSLQNNKNINRPNEYKSKEIHNTNFNLLSKQNNYEFVEFKANAVNIDRIYKFSEPEEFNIFSNDGKILIPGKDYSIKYNNNFITTITITNYDPNSNSVYEIIPEFDSNRKIRFGGTVKTGKNIDEFNKSFLKTGRFFNNGNYVNFDKRIYINGFLSNANSYTAENNILVILTDFLDNGIKNDNASTTPINFAEDDTGSDLNSNNNIAHVGSDQSNPFLNNHGDNLKYQPIDDFKIFENDILTNRYFNIDKTSGSFIINDSDGKDTKYPQLMGGLLENIKTAISDGYSKYDSLTVDLRTNLKEMVPDKVNKELGNTLEITKPFDFIYLKIPDLDKDDNTLNFSVSIIGETFNLKTEAVSENKEFIILPFWNFNVDSDPDYLEDVGNTSIKNNYFLKYWMLNNKIKKYHDNKEDKDIIYTDDDKMSQFYNEHDGGLYYGYKDITIKIINSRLNGATYYIS